MKILVCEDDEVVLKVIQVALESDGVEIVAVNNGQKALDQLAQHNFDLIITDLHMPYVNGDAILEFIKGKGAKKIPLIMISSDNEEDVVKMALQSGVSAFIPKPVKVEKLRKVVADITK